MRITRLQASDYRNIERLDIELREGTSVFVGDNAQGKSNLLEAVYLLATMRALRAETDAQLIRRESLEGVLPAARVVGEVDTPEAGLKLEVTVMARPGSQGPIATKTVKVNGVARRLGDAIGRLTAVLFTADDLELVNGSPSLRRRFLDTALSQIDARYAATRQRFDKVLNQRNHLLKRIREGESRPDELQFWDEQLCNEGALIFRERAVAVAELRALAGACHALLAPGETLALEYQPRLPRPPSEWPSATTTEDLAAALGAALRDGQPRDIAAGMTLSGPHRDDLTIILDGLPAAGYASRAQQRTIALALRLAEARLLTARRGTPPVLLLDDILSEMDAARRHSVLVSLSDAEQMLITGTDWDRFPEEFLTGASPFQVEAGTVRCVTPPAVKTED